MVDNVTKERRSYIMSRIRSKNTRPEMIVRKAVHRIGLRFRIHNDNLPGKPDLVLKKHGLVIFVNGCFWHQHKGCKVAHVPKSNREFWEKRFRTNVARDKKNIYQLKKDGWEVVIIWECEIPKDINEVMKMMNLKLRGILKYTGDVKSA